MTPSELERLAVLETRIGTVDKRTERIEAKLDSVMQTKADKTAVDDACGLIADHDKQLATFRGGLIIVAVLVPLLSAIISGIAVAVIVKALVGS
jgi:hypothetical protein